MDNIALRVKKKQAYNSEMEDSIVYLSNHTACECACVPQHCKPRQWYNEDNCGCECIHSASSCDKLNNRVWDHKSCKCVCNVIKVCQIMSRWSYEFCMCVPVEISGHVLN